MARYSIVEHPITSYEVVKNPFGDEEEVAGYYIGVRDPVGGDYIIPTYYESYREAFAAILEL